MHDRQNGERVFFPIFTTQRSTSTNDKPSPPSEIVSDRPLERLIFGVAVKKTKREKISSCFLRRKQGLAQGGNCNNVPLVYRRELHHSIIWPWC